jgi:hypothetical protein
MISAAILLNIVGRMVSNKLIPSPPLARVKSVVTGKRGLLVPTAVTGTKGL